MMIIIIIEDLWILFINIKDELKLVSVEWVYHWMTEWIQSSGLQNYLEPPFEWKVLLLGFGNIILKHNLILLFSYFL